jgi:hypothetical protein
MGELHTLQMFYAYQIGKIHPVIFYFENHNFGFKYYKSTSPPFSSSLTREPKRNTSALLAKCFFTSSTMDAISKELRRIAGANLRIILEKS